MCRRLDSKQSLQSANARDTLRYGSGTIRHDLARLDLIGTADKDSVLSPLRRAQAPRIGRQQHRTCGLRVLAAACTDFNKLSDRRACSTVCFECRYRRMTESIRKANAEIKNLSHAFTSGSEFYN